MTLQRTFSIIKPDATKRNLTGEINTKFEAAGLSIIAQKKILIDKKETEKSLKMKVLNQEHILYAQSIISIFK